MTTFKQTFGTSALVGRNRNLSITLAAVVALVIFLGGKKQAVEKSTEASWQDRLPYSMNGEKPNWDRDTSRRNSLAEKRWHDSLFDKRNILLNWKAEEFFEDEGVVELIRAISRRDIVEMERLIASGVDVNSQGIGGMNPLYWSWYVDDDPRPFELLMKHGADPNILVDGRIAVVHLVSRLSYNRLFQLVFENGGDPNLFDNSLGFSPRTPFMMLNTHVVDEHERFRLLLERGANIDTCEFYGETKLFQLISAPNDVGGSRYRAASLKRMDRALELLEFGADVQLDYFGAVGNWKPEWRGCHFRIIHIAALVQDEIDETDLELKKKFRQVIDYLESVGESLDVAKEDLERWKKWIKEKRQLRIEDEWYEKTLAEITSAVDEQDKKRWPQQLFSYVTRPSSTRLKLARKLLEAGADYRCDYSRQMVLWRPKWSGFKMRLIHILSILSKESESGRHRVGASKADFVRVIYFLEANGESPTKARADLNKWAEEIEVRKAAKSHEKP